MRTNLRGGLTARVVLSAMRNDYQLGIPTGLPVRWWRSVSSSSRGPVMRITRPLTGGALSVSVWYASLHFHSLDMP